MQPHTRQAVTTALATVLATLAAFWLELDNPWWASFSAFIISHGDRHKLILKGMMRMVATLVGVAIGFQLAVSFQGISYLQAVILFVTAFFLTRQRFVSTYAYAWLIGMLMIAMMMFVSVLEPIDLRSFAYARIAEVGLGVGICTLVNYLIPGGVAEPAVGARREPELVDLNRVALLAATVTIAVPLLWSYLELPSMVQIGVTTLAMIDRDLIVTRTKSGVRLLGCFTGGLMGLFLVSLGLNNLFLWLGVFFFSLVLFGRIYHGEGKWSYFGKQACLALIITFVTSSGPPDSIMPVVDRFSGILCGSLVIIAASFIFAPRARPAEEVVR